MFRRQPEFHVSVEGEVVCIEGHRLEQLTEELQRLCHGRVEVLSVERFIVGGIAGFFGREYFRIEARAQERHLRASGSADADDLDSQRSDDALDAQSFAAALAAALEEQGAAPTVLRWPTGADPEVLAQLAAEPADELVDHLPPPPPPPPPPPAQGPPAQDPQARGATVGDAAVDPDPARTWQATAPTERLAGGRSDPVEQDGVFVHLALPELNLSDLLDRLDPLVHDPVLPPEHGIVAVVGDPVHAARTAERLSEGSGGPEQSVVLLVRDSRREHHEEWPVLTDLSDAIAERRRWRNRPHPTFVAIALDLSEEGIRWVRNALIALEPVHVRYAAPAWRSPDEHVARVDAITGVDAIDLVDLDASEEPSAFLGMSPPVATLDGRPASAGLWAAYLLSAPTPLRATDHDLAGSCA